jgi:hypothetical protein
VLVSVDGLNPRAIRVLDRAGGVPALHTLRAEGASTLNARTAYELTNTLPNHTGMLTGRPVLGRHGHRVTFNDDHAGTLRSVSGRYVPGVFDPVHDAGLSTALLAGKSKFAFLVRSWDAEHGAPDRTGHDDGRDKIDLAEIGPSAELVRTLVERLRSAPPRFTFLHLRDADDAGHGDDEQGFMGPRYLTAVARVDRYLGDVLDVVRTTPRLRGRTTIVVTADHGGSGPDDAPGLGHRDPTRLANYRIPFVVWGPGVPAGADLYALNRATRRDPGTARVPYTARRQPIRNLDAADLVLRLLGLAPLRGTLPDGVRSLPPLRVR